jgi:hypothetical protein
VLLLVLKYGTIIFIRGQTVRNKSKLTLQLIFKRPVSGNIRWKDIESLFLDLGAEIEEREGSRVAIILFQQVKVFHRPHPKPDTDKGAVASVRKWLEENGVTP